MALIERARLIQARRWLRAGLDIVLPPQSLDLDRAGPAVQSSGLSVEAWRKIVFLEAPVCDACGAALAYDEGEGARCGACVADSRAFDRIRAAVLYDDCSRDLILKLKHADRTDLAGLFALWLSRAGRDLFDDADALVPVPLHRGRLFARRYNQAAEIARPLSRLTGVAHWPGVLMRRRDTLS